MAEFSAAGGGAGIATDAIWAAAGDIVYATADNAASVLGVGTNSDILQLSSGIPDWTCAPTLTGLTIASSGAIELGHACDTTLARASAGDVNIQSNIIYRACGTDVPVADGGTGLSCLTTGYILIGTGSSAVTLVDMTGKGDILIGDGTTAPRVLDVGSNCKILTACSSEATGVKWGCAPGGGTTINNATANELVTVGACTDELDAEANLTFDGAVLTTTHTSSGHALEVKSTGADSNAQLRITNDAQSWEFRVKGDASDIFTITDVTAGDLSGLEHRIKIDTNGAVTMAAQPAVLANNSSADNNVTGNNTVATVDYDNEIFDQGGDFASDTFTAPVTGRYFINAGVGVNDQAATAVTRAAIFVASNRQPHFIYDVTKVAGTPFGHSIWRGATIIDMDAADTLTISVRVNGQGSDAVAVTDTGTYISICLLA